MWQEDDLLLARHKMPLVGIVHLKNLRSLTHRSPEMSILWLVSISTNFIGFEIAPSGIVEFVVGSGATLDGEIKLL
jgi:hypothetical protein